MNVVVVNARKMIQRTFVMFAMNKNTLRNNCIYPDPHFPLTYRSKALELRCVTSVLLVVFEALIGFSARSINND